MIASGYSYRWNARGRKYLTAAERTRFLAAVRTHPKPAVQTLALTGCRVSEALATRACDVDLKASDVRIATFKRRRSHGRAVPAPEDLAHGQRLCVAHLASCQPKPPDRVRRKPAR